MSNPRQLAAIMFTDIVGYTALMQQDEPRALALLKHYNEVLEKWVGHFNGKISNYYGDGSLCIFTSATEAVNASVAIQKDLGEEPRVPLRIGLHIGEVFYENDKALGDGVNVASRVQSLGQGNTIFLSAEVYDKIRNNPELSAVSLGRFDFKNVNKPMEVYALSNEGLFVPQRKHLDGKLKKKRLSGGQKLLILFAALLLAAGGLFAYKKLSGGKDDSTLEKSIAVLPFADMSQAKDQEYLADGLAEEIINSLTTLEELKVIGRTSSFQFKGKQEDLREIGRKLHAGMILEGSVQQSGNRVRITAQLVRVKDNSPVWSQQYDREMTDIFKIQDDIATNITQQLRIALSDLQKKNLKRDETNPEAYSAYLKGLYAYQEKSFEQSITYQMQAITADPGFALPYAYIALAKTWIIARDRDFGNTEAIRDAKQFAEKASQLSSSIGEGYSALGLMAWVIERDFPAARRYFDQSVARNPGASLIRNRYAYFLTWMGDFDKAREMALGALESDPIDINSYINLTNAYLYSGQYTEARRYLSEGQQLFADSMGLGRVSRLLDFLEGKYDLIIREGERLTAAHQSLPGDLPQLVCMAYFRKGQLAKSNELLNEMEASAGPVASEANAASVKNDTHFRLAEIFATRNQPDSAVAWLKKSFANLESGMHLLKISPFLKSLQDHPEYKRICREYGF